jgi:hypothetical protein
MVLTSSNPICQTAGSHKWTWRMPKCKYVKSSSCVSTRLSRPTFRGGLSIIAVSFVSYAKPIAGNMSVPVVEAHLPAAMTHMLLKSKPMSNCTNKLLLQWDRLTQVNGQDEDCRQRQRKPSCNPQYEGDQLRGLAC